jgi:hypothetical protein
MSEPTRGRDQIGPGRRATIAIVLGLLLAASAVHSVDGGPARFLQGGSKDSVSTLAVGHQP